MQSIWEYYVDHFDHWFSNSSIFMYTELAQGSFFFYIGSSSTLYSIAQLHGINQCMINGRNVMAVYSLHIYILLIPYGF